MVDQVFHLASAIARGIPDLLADLADGLALPGHLARGEVPVGMAGHAAGLEIGLLVAGVAAHRLEPMAVSAARDRRLMQAGTVALVRPVAGRMTVGAARMRQHLPSSVKIAAERFSVSPTEAKLSGEARAWLAVSDAA